MMMYCVDLEFENDYSFTNVWFNVSKYSDICDIVNDYIQYNVVSEIDCVRNSPDFIGKWWY